MSALLLLIIPSVVTATSLLTSVSGNTVLPYFLESDPPPMCNLPSGIPCKESVLVAFNAFEALLSTPGTEAVNPISVTTILKEAQVGSIKREDLPCVRQFLRLHLRKVYIELDAFESLLRLNQLGSIWAHPSTSVVSNLSFKEFWNQQRKRYQPNIKNTNHCDAYNWYKHGIEPMVGRAYHETRLSVVTRSSYKSDTTVVVPTTSTTLSIIAVIRKSLNEGIDTNYLKRSNGNPPTWRTYQEIAIAEGRREQIEKKTLKDENALLGRTSLSDTSVSLVNSTVNRNAVSSNIQCTSKKRKGCEYATDDVEPVKSASVITNDEAIVDDYIHEFLQSLLQDDI